MVKKKDSKTKNEEIKVGDACILTKVWIMNGKTSGVPLGVRIIELGKIPNIGQPIYGAYTTEHPSGDPKEVTYVASSKILEIKNVPNSGMVIRTETSILLLQRKK